MNWRELRARWSRKLFQSEYDRQVLLDLMTDLMGSLLEAPITDAVQGLQVWHEATDVCTDFILMVKAHHAV